MPTVEGEYQAEMPVEALVQQQKRDKEVEDLRAENKRLSEKEDEETAAERERLSKEKQELLAAEEEQMKQTQFADALAEVKPQATYQEPTEDVTRNPELYQQNLGFEVQQANNLFQSSITRQEVAEAKFGGYFGDGGKMPPYISNYGPEDKQSEYIKSKWVEPNYQHNSDGTYYDPMTQTIHIAPEHKDDIAKIEHEKMHHWQNLHGALRDSSSTPIMKKPHFLEDQNFEGDHYYDRRDKEAEYTKQDYLNSYPEARFLPDQVLRDKVIDPAMYNNPYSLEGEGRAYEDYIASGGSPTFKDGGPVSPIVNNSGPRNENNLTYYSENVKNEDLPLSSSPSYRAYTMGKTGAYDEVTKRMGEVDDSAEFNNFYQSLPISLQTEDNLDNLHSLWVESGKVNSYDEIETPDNFDFERQVLEEEEFDLGGTFDKLLDPNNITAFKQKYGI
jgi:hypothetical protein